MPATSRDTRGRWFVADISSYSRQRKGGSLLMAALRPILARQHDPAARSRVEPGATAVALSDGVR